MKAYVNENLEKTNEGIKLVEVNIDMENNLKEFLYVNRGKEINVDELLLVEDEIQALYDYAIISKKQTCYNLIPNLNYSMFGLEAVSLLEVKNIENYAAVGTIEIPYYQGNIKHTYDVETIAKLKNASYKIPDPNISFMPFDISTTIANKPILDFGFLRINYRECMLKEIYSVSYHVSDNLFKTIPLYIGGDHSISYPIVKGIKDKLNKDITFVYLDAHLDVSKEHMLMNSNVVDKISNLDGIRVINFGLTTPLHCNEINNKNSIYIANSLKEVIQVIKESDNLVYISVDLDVFESNWIPNVTFPSINGISFNEFYDFLQELLKEDINVVACDVVELNAHPQNEEYGLVNAGYVIYSMLQFLSRN